MRRLKLFWSNLHQLMALSFVLYATAITLSLIHVRHANSPLTWYFIASAFAVGLAYDVWFYVKYRKDRRNTKL